MSNVASPQAAKVALLYPPACDPTAPYLSVPTLTAWLRRDGVDVVPIDANAEAFDFLLRKDRLQALADKLEGRLARLEKKASLTHPEQLAYAALWAARADAAAAPDAIDAAVALMRGRREGFYDAATYANAVAAVESALRLISAAYAPLSMSFTQYRTPFSLLDAEEVKRDARAERNPFHDYYAGPLCDRIAREAPDVIGISIAFPGQIQPAYALASSLRERFPGVHLTAGGPALTQLLQGLDDDGKRAAMGSFDTLVAYEGEKALSQLVRDVVASKSGGGGGLLRRAPPSGIIHGEQIEDLRELPRPDFDGLPFHAYLTPEPVLPYDPTRGCYWGKCTFCHYGLADVGTARYRERPPETVLAHLDALQEKHGVHVFYLSQDAVNPKTVLKIARALKTRGAPLPYRWSTDMRPERSLTPELCAELVEGGALSMALGVESASPRVLSLIDKGVPVETVARAIENLAGAGVGVECMSFTDFPTETAQEALATVRFIEEHAQHLSLFICGEFDLTKGSLVAQKPSAFGIAETWRVQGDELGCGLFWRHEEDPKTDDDRARVDDALARASEKFRLSRYPWAGALSTAHTLLWYARFGVGCFRAPPVDGVLAGAHPRTAPARFDVARVTEDSAAREAEIWSTLVNDKRAVSRDAWRALADAAPPAQPSPSTWRYSIGEEPERISAAPTARAKRGPRPGRRLKHDAALSKDPVRGW